MKKLFTIFLIICSSTALMMSCQRDDCSFKRDITLAGSISDGNILNYSETKITYDGIEKKDNQKMSIKFSKLSKTHCLVDIFITLDGNAMIITIPKIEVSGVPFDVYIDSFSDDAIALCAENQIQKLKETSIKGWIQEPFLAQTRCSPYFPMYESEMTIECLFKNKPLILQGMKTESY